MKRAWLLLSVAACGATPTTTPATDPPAAPPVVAPADAAAPQSVQAKQAPAADTSQPPDKAAMQKPSGPPPPLPKGTTVLHVGDSMADALGKDLRRELGQRGIQAPLKYQEATYIPQWAGFSMGFDALIAQHDPDLVIITLGGNEVAMPDPSVRAPAIKQLVAKVGDRPCLWVGAPLWPGGPHSGILDVIRDNCAPCLYVDTNALIPDLERLGDKVHPTIPERRRWAKFMIRWLRHNRDPDGERPWDFKSPLQAPPPESERWE